MTTLTHAHVRSVPLRLLSKLGVACAVVLIRSYQIVLAPLFVGGCRHIPSCSEYGLEAFRHHGVMRGLKLTALRVWRCRPGGTFGHDPVPENQVLSAEHRHE